MTINVSFKEQNERLSPQFGEVHNISDGGYERGYAAGYADGKASIPDYAALLISNNLAEYANDEITSIRASAFTSCTSLVSIDVPKVTVLGASCFQACAELKIVNAPAVKTINAKSFTQCSTLERIEFPNLTTFSGGDNFTYCYSLKYVDLGNVEKLNSWTFASCKNLEAVIFRKTNGLCTLSTTNAFSDSGVASGKGYIYVPDNLVEQYKTAANWSTYANQIKPLSALETEVSA